MPIETATYIHDLNAANPIHTDPLNQADSHMRLTKTVLQNTFPNATAAITGTPTQLNTAAVAFANTGVCEVAPNGTTLGGTLKLDPVTGSGMVAVENTGTNGQPGAFAWVANDATNANTVTAATLTRAGAFFAAASVNAPSIQKNGNELLPTGVICMWSGASTAIPAGWALCNGLSGTPDLRGMFVIGAGGAYAVGATGGAASTTPTTSSDGSHTHGGLTGLAGGHTHAGSSDVQGSHSHGGADGLHTLTISEIPNHGHNMPAALGAVFYKGTPNGNGSFPFGGNDDIGTSLGWTYEGGNGAHNHSISVDGAHAHNIGISTVGDHQHSISTDGAHTHTVTVATLPPYYALCFIMKL